MRSGDQLAAGFADPPETARVWVLGFALNGNLTKAGLTADLEALALVGIDGIVFMETSQSTPPGPFRFGTIG